MKSKRGKIVLFSIVVLGLLVLLNGRLYNVKTGSTGEVPNSKVNKREQASIGSEGISSGAPTQPQAIEHKSPVQRSYSHDVLLLLQRHPGIPVTREQAAQLQQIYGQSYEERLAQEAKLAVKTEISPTENLVEIPSYPEAGTSLRLSFELGVKAVLGTDVGERFLRENRVALETFNKYWGTYPQTILIDFDPSTASYNIQHNVVSVLDVKGMKGISNSTLGSRLTSNHLDIYTPFAAYFPSSLPK